MQIEFFMQGKGSPALYDWMLTAHGELWRMSPHLPDIGLLQIVLENCNGAPTDAQVQAIKVLRDAQSTPDIVMFGDCFVGIFN